jgi:hypothetical protein
VRAGFEALDQLGDAAVSSQSYSGFGIEQGEQHLISNARSILNSFQWNLVQPLEIIQVLFVRSNRHRRVA